LQKKNVTRKKERSTLTIIGVLLAVAATISLVSIAEGLYQRLNHEIQLQAVDLYVLPKSSSFMPAGSMGAIGSGVFTIPREFALEIESFPGVKNVTGVTRLLTAIGEDKIGVVIWAIPVNKINVFFPKFELEEGDFIKNSHEIIVGPRIASGMKIEMNSEFPISGENFSVVGKSYSMGSFLDYSCFISLEDALVVQKVNGVQEVWVQLEEPSYPDEVIASLKKFEGITVKTKKEYLGDANDFVGLVRLLQYAISAIGILIAITASMNTMLMSTFERMGEFGTLRAIGVSRLFIFAMVLFESLFLSIIGGFFGVLLGFFGAGLFNDAIVALLKLSFPVSQVTTKLVVEALVLSMVVGILGAIIPAFIASRMDIIKALRWE